MGSRIVPRRFVVVVYAYSVMVAAMIWWVGSVIPSMGWGIPDERRYWLELSRTRDIERLYFGQPGKPASSRVVRVFSVKSGVSGQSPTPIPERSGREYWRIVRMDRLDPESGLGPYFLALDIPYRNPGINGPVPYPECDGQCVWDVQGEFGLHGVSGDASKLDAGNAGSSGCVRHSDRDIAFLHGVIEFIGIPVRYYIKEG